MTVERVVFYSISIGSLFAHRMLIVVGKANNMFEFFLDFDEGEVQAINDWEAAGIEALSAPLPGWICLGHDVWKRDLGIDVLQDVDAPQYDARE